jgi:thiopurine S-methyltransferase
MAHPDHALWKRSWSGHRIDFHLLHVHPLLVRFWHALGLADADRVFVPLCGKSLDLMWLYQQGHDVVGVELSPLAIKAFFAESGLGPRHPARHGSLTRASLERLTLYCGDFFHLKAADLEGVRGVYDRASLTALPEALRARYVAHLASILPARCRVLLLTVEDIDDGESEAEASLESAEIAALYSARFAVKLLHAECLPAVVENGSVVEPRCVHKAYVLLAHASLPEASGQVQA